jgi:DNA-binding winged helix-turn-helix (wHTH) protein
MLASGSTQDFTPFPWSQHPAARSEPDTPPPLRDKAEVLFASFRLLPAQFLLLERDQPVQLGSRALEILIALLDRPGGLLSKQEPMARVWPDAYVGPANLTVHVSALRRSLRDGRDGNRFIINIPGRGYRFVAPVVAVPRQRPALAIVSPKAPEPHACPRRRRSTKASIERRDR